MAININAVSGAYFGTYGGEYVGMTEDGYELEQVTYTEPLRGDILGDAVLDEIYRGTDVFVNFVLLEYIQAAATSGGDDSTAIFHPHDDVNGQIGKPGVLRGGFSASNLVLTEYSSSTTSNPTTVTFTKSCLAANFPVRLLMANRLKRIPMRMQAYPYFDPATVGYATAYTSIPAASWFTIT